MKREICKENTWKVRVIVFVRWHRKSKALMLTSCFPHVGLFTLLSYFYTQNSDTSYLQGDKNRPHVQPGSLVARTEKRRWVYCPPDLWPYQTDIKIVRVGQAVSSNRCWPAQTQYGRPVLLGGRLEDRLGNKELTRLGNIVVRYMLQVENESSKKSIGLSYNCTVIYSL